MARTAQDIMTRRDAVLAFGPDEGLASAIEKLAERHFSGAPVIEDGRVVGVISESDLIGLEEKSPGEEDGMKVKDVMVKNAVTVKLTADLAEILKVMSSKKINRVIVVDQEGRLSGLIARDDVMRAAVSEL